MVTGPLAKYSVSLAKVQRIRFGAKSGDQVPVTITGLDGKTLEGTAKVSVVLKAKKIEGEKDGKRFALAKGGKFVAFKDNKVVIEFDVVKLDKVP